MKTVLITAFEPYDHWQANSSWLTLVELTRHLSESPRVTTRLYPVDFDAVRENIRKDLAVDFDLVLHLGQAPGSACIQLESIAVNKGICSSGVRTLDEDGPVGYQSTLPLDRWAAAIADAGIPASVSYHAGTYLCNAALYYSLRHIEQENLKTEATFIHLPLDVSQITGEAIEMASMPSDMTARAVRLILEQLVLEKLA